MEKTAISERFVLLLFVFICSTNPLLGQTSNFTWAEAVTSLRSERGQAEVCVALIKRYGNESEIAKGRLVYTKEKSDSDAVIAGLTTALALGGTPESLSSLQARLTNSARGLDEFCNSVSAIVPVTPGQKGGILAALAKIVDIDLLINTISAGLGTLYKDWHDANREANREARDANRQALNVIQTQLEGARWPDFQEIKPAQ